MPCVCFDSPQALLSVPVDLSALVSLSRNNPQAIFDEVGLLNTMVERVLNSKNENRMDKDCRLDVLLILANLAKDQDEFNKEKIRNVVQGLSTLFEGYLDKHEASPSRQGQKVEPEMHKAILLLLARAYDYGLRTEDLLELTGGDRELALESVVGLLEDGETVLTEVVQRQAPGEGQRAQWEQNVAVVRHEKCLVSQMCRLLLGFTRADTYFSSLDEGFYYMEAGLELPEYTIEQFSVEMDNLLAITMRSKLVEHLAVAMNNCLFSDGRVLEVEDHVAVMCIHGFLQVLLTYTPLSAILSATAICYLLSAICPASCKAFNL